MSDPEHGANIRWAESEGLLDGLPLDSLDPQGFATRGEVAQVLHNVGQDVRYYGAKGDGVTDDWQAITNAMDAAAAAGQPAALRARHVPGEGRSWLRPTG